MDKKGSLLILSNWDRTVARVLREADSPAGAALTFSPGGLSLNPDMPDAAFQRCINPSCAATFGIDEVKVACSKCGNLLDIEYDWSRLPAPKSLSFFEHRWSTKGT